ncbi:Sec-independent protein translocase TatC [Desulfonispora thiosulfatigenes DSM 11270]|uniref:Sec-independent protein translocase protein TatC n=1 Tax=Desulfonispora thiosulfatigenes DSM 11270 TaxID=656914 RepID=A0A1W1VT76_DESTI|nr:twin-arginine translocase subunit TatC [Desulfonispora thiosulfatigenes]SMB96585.1 Sec-independent protein translocase TatC [Desulfonispora thiosulfatigenes DSM 11270]
MTKKDENLVHHLEDLRKVLLISFAAIFVGTIICYSLFLDQVIEIVVGPLNKLGQDLVFLGVTEGLFTKIKMSIFGGVIISSPVIIWQMLRFIFPALYSHEKKVFVPVFFLGIILFISGIVFGYKLVLDLSLKILIINFSEGLSPMISVSKYVSFVISFLLPFGIIFEIPLITFFLTKLGLISAKFLREKRKYVILIMFVLAAVLSPGPDVLAQLFLAIPMIVLYEISIIISALIGRKKQKKDLSE